MLLIHGGAAMNSSIVKTSIMLAIGFIGGIAASNFPLAHAATEKPDMASMKFMVSINEVKQNFVFADEFSGKYSKSVTLSSGANRTITLTPMIHEGMQVIELNDNGGITYMGLDGTTTNGKLMIQTRSVENMEAMLRAQGWSLE